jgi:hypothetical protein
MRAQGVLCREHIPVDWLFAVLVRDIPLRLIPEK